MATRPSWRGHLKLSLVTCPVALYNAVSPAGDVHFHMINPDTKHRVKSVIIDATTDEILERKDMLKGYEFAKGKYVTLTKDEIDAVRLESTKTIDSINSCPPKISTGSIGTIPTSLCPTANSLLSLLPSSARRWKRPGKLHLAAW